MGLGNRSARRHETNAAKQAVNDRSSWDFQPGQKVMTVDGFTGTIASVDDQPIGGAETYNVELDNKMGGGQYTSSQIWATNDTTASVHTAADDYPELGSILVDRPDIALNTTASYNPREDDFEQCPECSKMIDVGRYSNMGDHLEEEHGKDVDDYEHLGHGYAWEKRTSAYAPKECEYCAGDHETDDHQDEPDEEDTHLGYGHRGIDVSHAGKNVGTFPDVETATHAALHAQHDDGYFPNMWMHGEHGPTSRPLHEATDVEGHVQRWAPNIGGEGPMHQGAAPAREHGPIDSYSGKDEIGSHLVQEHGVHPNDLRVPVTIAPGHPAHPHGNNAILPHQTSRPASQEELLNHHEGLHEEGNCPAEGDACPWKRHGHTHAERDTSHLFDPSVFGDQGKRDWADFLMSDNHTGPTHLSAKDTSNGQDAWGRPLHQAYDGHSAWSCNNYGCAEHPQSLYPQEGQPQGIPGWLQHDSDPDGGVKREVDKHFHEDPSLQGADWLMGQGHTGPTHLSAKDETSNEGNEPGLDEHNHLTWGGHSPGCRDTDDYSMFGQNDAVEKQAARSFDQCGYCGRQDATVDGGLCPEHKNIPAYREDDDSWQSDDDHGSNHPHHAVVGPMDSGKPCTQCGVHGMLSCQETVGKCDSCGSPDTDIYRYRSGKYEQSPESLCLDCLGSGHHLDSAHDRDEADTESIDHLARRPADKGGFRTVWKKSASAQAFDPYQIIAAATADSDFRFHVVASWADVRAKAKRIRAEGGVHVTALSDGMLHAEVKGDHHVYETGIQRLPGKSAIAGWSCGCKWGAYHWGASDDFSRFAGRMCSHALAVQYEAQSRGMFGRDIRTDDSKPNWVPRRVVVKYDIDDSRNVSAPATPTRSDYGHAASLSVASALIARSQRDGEELADMTLALHVMGMGLPAIQAAVNNAWGEPSAPDNHYLPGPTMPKDPNANPASTGWASSSDPSSWSEAGPSGLDHTVSSLDDEAMFEPEMGKEAFLPLLALAPELLAGGEAAAAGAGAAGAAAGVGEAAAGAGEAAAGMGAKDVLNVGRGLNMAHNMSEGPKSDNSVQNSMPSAPHQNPDFDTPEGKNPLNYTSTMHEDPEGALPSTDGDSDSDDALSPESNSFVSTGSVADIVAQFQATAGANKLLSGRADADSSEIAAAAQAHLEKSSMKTFSPGEQHQIISEGENVKASNLDRLDIKGTHYEHLEAALAAAEGDDEDGWLA